MERARGAVPEQVALAAVVHDVRSRWRLKPITKRLYKVQKRPFCAGVWYRLRNAV